MIRLLPILLLCSSCFAGNVTLQCNSVTNAMGYKFYWGNASGIYTNFVSAVGPLATVPNLAPGSYFFAATATNSAGESPFSNEIAYTVAGTSVVLVFRLEAGQSVKGPFKALTTVPAFTIVKPTNGIGFFRVAMTETNE